MVKKLSAFIILTLFFSVFSLWADSADAARFGGGRSFGSRPSYQRSMPAPASPQRSYQTPNQQSSPYRTSPFGGARGLFGGLLMGTLLGSLFFGGGFHGIGMIDFLIFGFLIFLLMRFLRSRRTSYQTGGYGGGGYTQQQYGEQPGAQGGMGSGPGNIWDSLRGSEGRTEASDMPGPEVPAGFDSEEFLKGAKAAYVKLQEAWDRRDLNEIRHFASREVYEEIRSQAEHDPTPSKTELLMINARLMEAKQAENETIATVFFDVLMREGGPNEPPRQVREVWHFSCDQAQKTFWVVEGIQQVDN